MNPLSSTKRHLLEMINAAPQDRGPQLVMADYCEEQSEMKWALFYRGLGGLGGRGPRPF